MILNQNPLKSIKIILQELLEELDLNPYFSKISTITPTAVIVLPTPILKLFTFDFTLNIILKDSAGAGVGSGNSRDFALDFTVDTF